MRGTPRPLYRKVNTRTRGVKHGSGQKFSWDRHTKKALNNPSLQASMHGGQQHGRDYTPLFRFLLSRVGQRWDDVFREACARLDGTAPIFSMVATCEADRCAYFRADENSYFSGLFVDEDGILSLVAPEMNEDSLKPTCACCTHSFNGKVFTQRFGA
ncbi:hypothetical protein LV564_04875 [Komagataeibacter nataicola]|uniref:hypothetical protein n=1 Tax=Komagataeibacter nataicola TaxID=265960 RepID=UPI0023DD349F|nr:hypothetical protein [Komagataeibacter nataicola]WEQ56422.1 hypothetical protein LV564_04875 [Komagataeibacter nataicola]